MRAGNVHADCPRLATALRQGLHRKGRAHMGPQRSVENMPHLVAHWRQLALHLANHATAHRLVDLIGKAALTLTLGNDDGVHRSLHVGG